MSTDWNVHCLDCNNTLHFDDANHQLGLMRALCRHAKAIAPLAELVEDPDVGWAVDLRTSYGPIDPRWFKQHATHRLAPISEYGDLDGECGERIVCAHCDRSSVGCTLERGHDGEHRRTRPT
jgi:hypothetical protein